MSGGAGGYPGRLVCFLHERESPERETSEAFSSYHSARVSVYYLFAWIGTLERQRTRETEGEKEMDSD